MPSDRRTSARSTSLDDVCVISAGARTAAGHDLASTAAAVRAGLVCFDEHPTFTDSDCEPIVAGRASRRPPWQLDGAARCAAFATSAAREALRPIARRSARAPYAADVYVGLSSPRPGRPADLRFAVDRAVTRPCARWLAVRGRHFVERGHASGLTALEQASESLANGDIDFALVGGVDSYLDAETLAWLEDDGRLHAIGHVGGFTPAEGAGFVLLALRRVAQKIGLTPELTLVATATDHESSGRSTGRVSTGDAASRTFRAVTKDALAPRARIDHAFGDLNGEPDRVDEIGFALSRTSSAFAMPSSMTTPSACYGDTGAAAGPLLVGLALAFARRAPAAGGHSLVWSASDDGTRAAALFRNDVRATRTLR